MQWVAFLVGMVANTYVMTILYLVALIVMMWTTYLYFARWYVLFYCFLTLRAKTADIAYGKNIFDRGIHHPGFITFMIVFGLGLAVLSVFYALVTSILLLVMSFAIWVTTLVALSHHRQHYSQFPGNVKEVDVEDREFSPFVISHKHLESVCTVCCAYLQLVVTLIMMSSVLFFKSIFVLVCFCVDINTSNIFATVFCFPADLVFAFLLSSPAKIEEFEVSQYRAAANDRCSSYPMDEY